MNFRSRSLLKNRLLRAQKKNQGVFIALIGILFVANCLKHYPRSLSSTFLLREAARAKQTGLRQHTVLSSPSNVKHSTGMPLEGMPQTVSSKVLQMEHFRTRISDSIPSLHSKASQRKETGSKNKAFAPQSLYSNDRNRVLVGYEETEEDPKSFNAVAFETHAIRKGTAEDGPDSTSFESFGKKGATDVPTSSNLNSSPASSSIEHTQNTGWGGDLEITYSPVIDEPYINGGKALRIQAEWNRLHSPWFQPQPVKLLTPEESNYRYLYSSVRVGTSDGIGHSMGVVNRDFNFAISLNLTYTHRVGMYSSLTSRNRYAVEDFFGWGEGEIPRTDIQKQGCVPKNNEWPGPTHIAQCHICERPMPSGSLKIKHLVDIPTSLISNCLSEEQECHPMKSQFLLQHQQSHTVFQASRRTCSPPPTDGNFVYTKNLFFHKYWNRHGQLPWNSQRSSSTSNLRPIRYKQEELNIAVHVRRGDFLNPETQAKRGITKDETFAKVLIDVLSIVDGVGGIFSKIPIRVHIYSEGKLTKNQVLSVHAIDTQDKKYYDSNGTERDADWWTELILQTTSSLDLSSLLPLRERLKVVMHISEDTLLCLHEMISADVFIGSRSGLSNALVWSLARGIVLIPHASTISIERGKKGEICCSVPFTNSNGSFDHRLFNMYWTTYVRANEASVLHATTPQNTRDLDLR